jgi:hypothetical protein
MTNYSGINFCVMIVHSLAAKLVLALASTVILGSESHGTCDHILLSDSSGSCQAPKLPHIVMLASA